MCARTNPRRHEVEAQAASSADNNATVRLLWPFFFVTWTRLIPSTIIIISTASTVIRGMFKTFKCLLRNTKNSKIDLPREHGVTWLASRIYFENIFFLLLFWFRHTRKVFLRKREKTEKVKLSFICAGWCRVDLAAAAEQAASSLESSRLVTD